MKQGQTKEKILLSALELFSAKGYEATSVSMIAEAVGIKKASLYSHFISKQAILDELIGYMCEQFEEKAVYSKADRNNPEFTKNKDIMTLEKLTEMISKQMQYVIHDEQISKVRKLLTTEQFHNPMIASVLTRQSYEKVMDYNEGLMRFLIKKDIFEEADPKLLAAEFALPISVWISICDRHPEREEEMFALLRQHVEHFFKSHMK